MSVSQPGALVVSLDFELHWGVRDHRPLDAAERQRLLQARTVVPEIVKVFREHSVRATWATVGLLFANSRDEAEACRPTKLPHYTMTALNPYDEKIGQNEAEDPFHFAPSLIRSISQEPGQEIASHSYSHYYSLEAGQGAEEFEADIAGARRIAENSGYCMRSYVFPRNQVRSSYLPILRQAGFCSYRGTEPVASKAPVTFKDQRKPWLRALRLMDAYCSLNGPLTIGFPACDDLVPVDASRYLRPYSSVLRSLEPARLRRIATAMRHAATHGKIFHLWWHPEDFAGHPERNLDFLHRVLNCFDQLRKEHGMSSLTMADVRQSAKQPAETVSCGALA